MGMLAQPPPALLLLAAFGQQIDALDWARSRAAATWGSIALESPAFDFAETNYYAATMGVGLKKRFLAFEPLVDPGRLAELKRQTNDWEAEYATLARAPVTRPLNLDPGYLTLGKLVLASTKDHWHRIYLGGGVFAEVTLHYRRDHWEAAPWTYPDYRRTDYQAFFSQARDWLRTSLRQEPTA
jgi:hypothetical protein